ncbi:Mannose-1-phosphate guanylyltransferase [Coriobacterium glomerans PW2]|uniref:Mannose-1-phosphate guanylyltransferase n=1 Tax=Coriobacterium glomerans (strain ATCC 49209 / DSM 20642 / JCM 10262 / PW2) TaxID=700015 RepID=F2N8B5_CORGP|nr:sugar phosphate nucleotidyltransferase [Coriobacterium glomerans]AEB07298.1 Mannose-1-phosphate guanylyltransferase [Coriobacterium glomerans PW2]
MIHIVLLSGGSGTRLWPLSNNVRSKQFLKVLRDAEGNHVSMVQRVLGQIRRVAAELDITIATNCDQCNDIFQQIGGEYTLVLEPDRRDTASAIMLACEHLALVQGANSTDTVIVMPIDTYAEQDYYESIPAIDDAVRTGASELVLLGVEPTYPSAKYGYIVPDEGKFGDLRRVSYFSEKPDEDTASKLIAQGALWNCCVFAFRLGYLLDLTRTFLEASSFEEYIANYSRLPKKSFDYEVVEKACSISVLSYAGKWKDLGTWNTLTDEMAEVVSGFAIVDQDTCDNVHVINETRLPIVVAGIRDAVVVVTPDGILACAKSESVDIKRLLAQLTKTRLMHEQCRWGESRVLDSCVNSDGNKSLTKKLIIKSGKQLPYQRHGKHSEVWTIVRGEGEIVLDGKTRHVKAGEVVNVEIGCMHACRGITDLHIIEVQYGKAPFEMDIVEAGNFWSNQPNVSTKKNDDFTARFDYTIRN